MFIIGTFNRHGMCILGTGLGHPKYPNPYIMAPNLLFRIVALVAATAGSVFMSKLKQN